MTKKSIRQACRDREPLGGPDAQALEGALSQVERELEAAKSQIGALKKALAAHHCDSNCLCTLLGVTPEDTLKAICGGCRGSAHHCYGNCSCKECT